MREPPRYERSPRALHQRGEPPRRHGTGQPPLPAREESPRSLHHKHNRRAEFGRPEQPDFDVASREGHPMPSPGRVPRENRDPSARLRDRRDEHVPAGEITPAVKRRDIVAHWERASVPDKRRTRT